MGFGLGLSKGQAGRSHFTGKKIKEPIHKKND